MSNPLLTDTGERLYSRLAPTYFRQDPQLGYPGKNFIAALARMIDPAADIVRAQTVKPFVVNGCVNGNFEHNPVGSSPGEWGTFSEENPSESATLTVSNVWAASGSNSMKVVAKTVNGEAGAVGPVVISIREYAELYVSATVNIISFPSGIINVGIQWINEHNQVVYVSKQRILHSAITSGLANVALACAVPTRKQVENNPEHEGPAPLDYNVVEARVFAAATAAGTQTTEFYIDDILVTTEFPREYFDGDSPGCEWTGTQGGSVSIVNTPAVHYPPYAILFNPELCPRRWLPWVGQFIGIPVVKSEELLELGQGITLREWLIHSLYFERGTTKAMEVAARATLRGKKTLFFYTRFNGEAFLIKAASFKSETPNEQETREAIESMMPAWCVLEFEVMTNTSLATLEAAHAALSESEAANTTVREVERNPGK